MNNKVETIEKVIELFDKHIRGAGDSPGVEGRVKDYMKEFIDPLLINPCIDIADIGCGDCFTSDYLLANPNVRSWVGINKGIDLFNNESKYNIQYMDFHFLDFKDEQFDIVLAVNVLEHSYFPALMLYELRRVTKEYVFIDLPLSMSEGGNHCHEENPDHHFLMSNFMWKKMFRVIGLEIIKEKVYGAEVQWLLKKTNPLIAS